MSFYAIIGHDGKTLGNVNGIGKTTFANLLAAFNNLEVVGLADEPKKLLMEMYDINHFDKVKNTYVPYDGITYREVLIDYAESVKLKYGKCHWVERLVNKKYIKDVVIHDVRFKEEVDCLKQYNVKYILYGQIMARENIKYQLNQFGIDDYMQVICPTIDESIKNARQLDLSKV